MTRVVVRRPSTLLDHADDSPIVPPFDTGHAALLRRLDAHVAMVEPHAEDVAELAAAVAARLGLDAVSCERVWRAARLRDVGKLALPRLIAKTTRLTEADWSVIRRHTLAGERIVSTTSSLADVASIVRSTHERIDGRGYPDGLQGNEIRVEARIIAVCDAFSAMTSERPYRPALTEREGFEELTSRAGTEFDRAAVDALIRVILDAWYRPACDRRTA